MITTYELPEILGEQLPELRETHADLKPLLRVFASVNSFADLTCKAIETHHYLLAGRCFRLAERLYQNGDRIIRSLIKYSFVTTCAGFMPRNEAERMFVKSLIPVSLYHLYEQIETTDTD